MRFLQDIMQTLDSGRLQFGLVHCCLQLHHIEHHVAQMKPKAEKNKDLTRQLPLQPGLPAPSSRPPSANADQTSLSRLSGSLGLGLYLACTERPSSSTGRRPLPAMAPSFFLWQLSPSP